MNVLIVDDNPTDLKLLDAVLGTFGHETRLAACAETALATAIEHPLDAILLDLQSPGMDGVALIRQLRAEPYSSNIPIIVLTAYPGSFARGEVLAAGCDEYFVKPIDARALPQALELVVSSLRRQRQ